MTQLRGETVAAVKAGTDDVFTRAGALMGSVRNELATTANGLRTEFQTSIRTETQKLSNDFSSRIARLPGRGMLDTDPGVVVRPLNP
jgi:hypothetical protein